jgi:hypothetical protein
MAQLCMASLAVLCVGCATTPKDYADFYRIDPHAVLIVPPVNNSQEVGADTYFLATVSLPLGERGYYVFPVNMTRELLIDAGLSDPGLVHDADPKRLGELFGADAILYITIEHWEARYLVLTTTVTVAFTYVLKETTTGKEIWRHHQVMEYTPQHQSTGNPIGDLIVMAVEAAVTKALPNYIPLARQANTQAFDVTGQGLPPGPHRSDYWKAVKH